MERKFFNIYIYDSFFSQKTTDFHEPFNRAAAQAAVVIDRTSPAVAFRFTQRHASTTTFTASPASFNPSLSISQDELCSAWEVE